VTASLVSTRFSLNVRPSRGGFICMGGKMLPHAIWDGAHAGWGEEKLRRASGKEPASDDEQDDSLMPPPGRSGPRPLPTNGGG
jgi:hypothetical protein